MQIPSKAECFRLLSQMEMMTHIVAHSVQVCRVALLLVDELNKANIGLQRDLVQASALLHDITKTRSFKTKENHAVTGAKWLEQQGYTEVGAIVRQHVRLDRYSATTPLTEIEVVNYADKRVMHDRIVTLPQRMSDILERYAKGPSDRERIREMWDNTQLLEQKLFLYISFTPEELISRLLT